MHELQRRIQIARGEIPAELVLRNARLVNVCSAECYPPILLSPMDVLSA